MTGHEGIAEPKREMIPWTRMVVVGKRLVVSRNLTS